MTNNFSKIIQGISLSTAHQEIIFEEDNLFVSGKSRFNRPASIKVTSEDCIKSAIKYSNCKVAVLNASSFVNPGGNFKNGGKGQEELICKYTNLYPCLDSLRGIVYKKHKSGLANHSYTLLYNDDCIYTPDIIVLKDIADFHHIDVISCSPPNVLKIGGSINVKRLLSVNKKRIERILQVAKNKKVDVLVLSDFGCDEYMNQPNVVAEALVFALMYYIYDFKEIVVSVPNEDACRIFKEKLSSYEVMV